MSKRILLFVALLAALLVVLAVLANPSDGTIARAAGALPNANVQAQPVLAPNAVYTDLAVQGTMWQPQTRGAFKQFMPVGWGTATQLKPNKPLDQWVHIGLPLITRQDSALRYIRYVEFCAWASNGAVTKPTAMDLWANGSAIGHYPFSWPADNGYHCYGRTFTPAIWKEALGISVLLHFANTTDTITLAKAWVQVSN